jgi:hypothetical protein
VKTAGVIAGDATTLAETNQIFLAHSSVSKRSFTLLPQTNFKP